MNILRFVALRAALLKMAPVILLLATASCDNSNDDGIQDNVYRAQEASAEIPGFGLVDGLYLYSFKPEGGRYSTPGLIPDVWALQPGDVFRYTLQNSLPCVPERPEGTDGATMSESNIHTHGLIVSPANDADGRYGDNVFVSANTVQKIDGSSLDCSDQTPSHNGHSASMTTIPYTITVPDDHPPGLYWFHPHSHGVSQEQIARGLAGIMTIGDIWDYTWLKCQLAGEGDDNPCANDVEADEEVQLREESKVDFLLLKDLQVERAGSAPWKTVEWYDPGFCGDGEYPRLEGGTCVGQNEDNSDDGIERRWLFTVNGELLPQLTVPDNAAQILRIANLGASVTYNLELRSGNTRLPFQITANDGVSVGQGADQRLVSDGDFVLFPSARLEIYLDRGEICASLGDECNGSTVDATLEITEWECPDGDPTSCADLWPVGRIMDIRIEGLDPTEIPRPVGAAMSKALAMLDPPNPPSSQPSVVCSDGSQPGGPLGPGEFRTIAFWNGDVGDDETFTMMTDTTPSTTPPVYDIPNEMTQEWLTENNFDEFDHDRTDLCITAENVETWLVYNVSDEFHNFHVHQSKFAITEISDYENITRETGSNVLHDNFPIPPNAWIKLKVHFANEVAGRFVYHCHILEHEDKGMMSVIEVVPSI